MSHFGNIVIAPVRVLLVKSRQHQPHCFERLHLPLQFDAIPLGLFPEVFLHGIQRTLHEKVAPEVGLDSMQPIETHHNHFSWLVYMKSCNTIAQVDRADVWEC